MPQSNWQTLDWPSKYKATNKHGSVRPTVCSFTIRDKLTYRFQAVTLIRPHTGLFCIGRNINRAFCFGRNNHWTFLPLCILTAQPFEYGFVWGENLCDRFILELVLECNCYQNPMWLNTKVAVPQLLYYKKSKNLKSQFDCGILLLDWGQYEFFRPQLNIKKRSQQSTKKSQICVPKNSAKIISSSAYPQIHQTHAMKKLDFSSLAYRAWTAQKHLKLHNDAFFIWSFVCSGIIYIFHST